MFMFPSTFSAAVCTCVYIWHCDIMEYLHFHQSLTVQVILLKWGLCFQPGRESGEGFPRHVPPFTSAAPRYSCRRTRAWTHNIAVDRCHCAGGLYGGRIWHVTHCVCNGSWIIEKLSPGGAYCIDQSPIFSRHRHGLLCILGYRKCARAHRITWVWGLAASEVQVKGQKGEDDGIFIIIQ